MQIQIFRSDARSYYPDEAQGYCYSFEPILGDVQTTRGCVSGSTDASDEPLATVEVPDGCTIAETKGGDMALFLPGESVGLSARDVYQMSEIHSSRRTLNARPV